MAVTLTNRYGDTSTPTLTTGSDDCDYVLVVGATSVERYTKTGATSYQFAYETQGLGGMTAGHVIGVTYVEGGSGGSGSVDFIEASPSVTEGNVLIADGTDFKSRPMNITDLADVGDAVVGSDKDFLSWSGDSSTGDWTNRTPAQSRGDIGLADSGFGFKDTAPADGDVVVCQYMPFAGTLTGFVHKLASGSFTGTVKINGTNVTGLASLSVTSSEDTATATAANTFAIGDTITMTIASSSSPGVFDGVFLYTR